MSALGSFVVGFGTGFAAMAIIACLIDYYKNKNTPRF